MTTLRTTTTTEYRKRVYFDGSPTHVFNDKCLTPLMKACMYGRPEQVRLILEEKPLAATERDGVFKTALHYCAENEEEDAECAKLLLEADSSIVNIPDEDGHTALHLAVIAGNLPLVRFLLVSGQADPNKRDAEGHSTVHWATVCADVDALELVLSHGGTTSSADVHGGYAIHYAAQMCGTGVCRTGDVRNVGVRVLQLLLSYGADVHVTDKHGRQPILWAASAGSADAIITLVNGGANVESHDKDGLTALHCAASRGHVECVDGLITLCGSDVDAVDSNRCSPLFYAVTLGHADATEMLLEHGANPDRQDGKGRTPAHCGAFKGQLETVRLLAEHGGNLWLRNSKGGYPLHDAVRSGRKELVQWLISIRPESVDYYDDDGKRPLHIASLNNNMEMCKIILDHGASINPVMKIKGERMTPLDVALRKNNGQLAKFLNLYGGKPASKLNKTLTKQSTIRVKTKRSESRRNSYSSDSISRKYRHSGARKKQISQRKNESLKANKTSKGRLVQVHIRADVLTKAVGKDKKSCVGGTLPRTRRRKASAAGESKEYFSENDMCYGGGDGNDYDDDEDDDDEDDDEEDDDDEDDADADDCGGGEGNGYGANRRRGGRVTEQTNGSAAAAAVDRCRETRRNRNGRRRGHRTTVAAAKDGGLESKDAGLKSKTAASDGRAPSDSRDTAAAPAAVKAEAVKEDAVKAAAAKADTIKAAAVKADTITADAVKADTIKAAAVKADTITADAVKAPADSVADGRRADGQRGDRSSNPPPGGVGRNAEKSKTRAENASGGGGGNVVKFADEAANDGGGGGGGARAGDGGGARAGDDGGTRAGDDGGTRAGDDGGTRAGDGGGARVGDGGGGGRKTSVVGGPNATGRDKGSIAAAIDGPSGGANDPPSRRRRSEERSAAAAAAAADDDDSSRQRRQRRRQSEERTAAAGDSGGSTTTGRGGGKVGGGVGGAPEKVAVERSPGRADGKTSKGQSTKSGDADNRAIVEVLDRVDTPQYSVTSSATVGGDGGGNIGEPTAAFSVLPDAERDDVCKCPDCRRKPSRSSSKKMKSRIPRLNNCCDLAPASDLNTTSVTKAVQLSSRKYHLERLIFYQLSELKRLQIRAGKSDERVLVKRLAEEYGKTGVFIGLKRYDGPFSFKRFEKYLYDQLLVLQKQPFAGNKAMIPRVQTIDEIEKLTGALRRIDAGKTVLERPDDCLSCIRTTNRCLHATHAYTGVPCAAYIPGFRLDHHRMPKPGRFLPDIRPDGPGATRCLRNVDPSRPITLQLANGPCTQAIELPTDRLDKNKRYLVTFTVKGAGDLPPDKHRQDHHDYGPDHCHTPPLAHTHAKSF